MSDYSRGSEWRKWDLHIHTPSSYDYKDKSITNEQIINILSKNNISLAVITDHHIIDITRINKLQDLGLQQNITILAGIELRSELGGSESIHFIGIFPQSCNLEEVWTDLQSKCTLKPSDIESKGNDNIYCDLKETAKVIHNCGGLVSIHAGNKTNSVENITNALPYKMAQKCEILENIDIYEVGKKQDELDYEKNVFPNIQKRPPVIVCSDNHNINNYELKEKCWIKADPAFEGLKQIIYEPDERVRIQEEKPEEKQNYLIIDKIKFIDDNFTNNEILINPNLTTIIGGKSTGKSILLRNIAKSIDSKEVSNRLNEVNLQDYEKNISGFEVFWKDGQIDKLNENATNKKIIYIPQSYLNRLIDKKDNNTSIFEIIKNIILQDENIKNVFLEIENKQRENQKNITQLINDYFFLIKDIENQEIKIKEIGDKIGIEKEIVLLEKETADLKLKAGLDDKEIESYNLLTNELKKLNEEKNITNNNKVNIIRLKEIDFFNNIELDFFSDDMKLLVTNKFNEIKERFKTELENSLNIIYDELKSKEDQLLNEINLKEIELKPLNEKIQKTQVLNDKIKKLENEKNSIALIEKDEFIIQKNKKKLEKIFEEIMNNFSLFYKILLENKERIKTQTIIKDDLNFDLEIEFRYNSFNGYLFGVLNNRKVNSFRNVNLSEWYNFKEIDQFKNDIKSIVLSIINGSLELKVNYEAQSTILNLLKDWFHFKFIITFEGDDISNMSPGKGSYVLLKLLIDLDKNKFPILLDQPEDDLDNNSISKDLVNFIKIKKKDRQFIIVTHNPNLVVGADSEEVIVANRQCIKSKNEKYNFEFISGSLENSKQKENCISVLKSQGIQEHVCDILEGGKEAFVKREKKYGFKETNP
jgi:ABC-type cobalamin/Fe3+-siderophores transport system ATPase subunit